MSDVDDQQTRVRIRRAPKFSVFLFLGALVGLIVAFVATSLSPDDGKLSFGAVFGYTAIYCVTAGVLLAAVIALVIDRASRHRAKTLTATVDRLQPDYDDGE